MRKKNNLRRSDKKKSFLKLFSFIFLFSFLLFLNASSVSALLGEPYFLNSNNVGTTSFNLRIDKGQYTVEPQGYEIEMWPYDDYLNFVLQVTIPFSYDLTLNYFVQNLEPNTEYEHRVRAVRSGYTSSSWDYWATTTNALGTLSTPTGLSNSQIATTSFRANWNSVSNAQNYEVELYSDSGYNNFLTGFSTSNLYSTFSNLNSNTIYYWRVRAINPSYTSSSWATFSVTTLDETPTLSTPTGLSNSQITNNSFRANWNSVSNAQNYEVEVHSNAQYTNLITGQTALNNYADFSGLNSATNYYWRVRANATGYNPSSWAEWGVTILEEQTQLTNPTGLGVSNIGTSYFRTYWNSVANAQYYEVEVHSNTLYTNLIAGYSTSNLNFNFTGLNSDTTYYFRVRAIADGYINSDWSNYALGITTLSEVLSTPTGLSNSQIATTSFRANWNSVSNAQNYEVEVHSNAQYTNLITGQTALNNYADFSTLNPNTIYYWRVRAIADSYTNSDWANNQVQTLQLTQLSTPTNLNNINIQTTSFRANWNSVANAQNYEVEVHSNAQYTNLITGQTAINNYADFSTLNPNTIYYWRVRAIADSYTNSDWANNQVQTLSSGIFPPTLLIPLSTLNLGYNQTAQINLENYFLNSDNYSIFINSQDVSEGYSFVNNQLEPTLSIGLINNNTINIETHSIDITFEVNVIAYNSDGQTEDSFLLRIRKSEQGNIDYDSLITKITNFFLNLFPSSESLTRVQMLAIVLISMVLITGLVLIISWTQMRGIPAIMFYIAMFLNFVIFVFFIELGYIPSSILIWLALLLIAFGYIKFRDLGSGGNFEEV